MGTGTGASRRDEVMRLLEQSPVPLPVLAIAERLELHPNTVRFHLERLVVDGRVERTSSDRGVPGRPAQLYRSVRAADGDGPRHYRMLAEVLADQLAQTRHPTAHALDAGKSWGRKQAQEMPADDPVEGLTELLDEIGFRPGTGSHDPALITAHRCPFLDLACRDPEVVCSIHLGLMQGVLDGWDAPVTVSRIDRDGDRQECVAHLVPRTTRTA